MELTASRIKFIRSLQQKKFRQETSLFVVEGEKLVNEALHSGFVVEDVYYREDIGEKAMERISSLSSPSPALAVVRQKEHLLSDMELSSGKLYLMLDGVRDPGNLGTILRLADWFGVSAVFCSRDCVELYNPKTVQATMGAVFRVPVCYCNLSEVVCKAEAGALPVFGTFLDGTSVLEGSAFAETAAKGGVIVLGSESNGISEDLAALIPSSRHLLIPSFDRDGNAKTYDDYSGSESLNVATACAALLFLVRSR